MDDELYEIDVIRGRLVPDDEIEYMETIVDEYLKREQEFAETTNQ